MAPLPMAGLRSRTLIPVWPGLAAVALMLVWGYHDGGYDADTWYWGALVALALLSAVVLGIRVARLRPSGSSRAAIVALGLYVAWSFLSITWARSPGDALAGSNRALLYLLVFTLFSLLPWTRERALMALLAFVLGMGAIAVTILIGLASGDHPTKFFSGGRLTSPTGYFNASAALFTLTAGIAIALAARREISALVRGLVLAVACGCLQLALLAQSRGWLFTLPAIVIAAILLMPDRRRVILASLLPIAGTLAQLGRLLGVFRGYQSSEAPTHALALAGSTGLAVCGAMLLAGTLIAKGEAGINAPVLSAKPTRALGIAMAAAAIAAVGVGGIAASHGHPFRFVARQWNGFTRTSAPSSNSSAASNSGSHFASVGSGRYDFWRVSLDALAAHPLGGLGQDNFADYYVRARKTGEEPRWTHSLEMRLLAHTGFVGFALFAAFLIAALAAAVRALRFGDDLARGVAGAALLPLVVWLVHGSVDWFWETPALTGPALGFLGMAGALGRDAFAEDRRERPVRRWSAPRGLGRILPAGAAILALLAATLVLGLPYLSVREVSLASDVRGSDPAAALLALKHASGLNPLSADPGRLAGAIALQTGRYAEAERRFAQAISREPGGWFSWLGEGLAASALDNRTRARHDFTVAASINSRQPAVTQALARVDGPHPLSIEEAFQLLVLVQ